MKLNKRIRKKLIKFLEMQDLNLKGRHFVIFREKEIDGRVFLKMEKQGFSGFEIETAVKLAYFAKEFKEKKRKAVQECW